MAGLRGWLRGFMPHAHPVSARERVLGAVGAIVGLCVTEWIGRAVLGQSNPWFIAPMGASAVLLFAAPSSPLAQPWSMLGGNVLAALVGVTCVKLIGTTGVAAALAVGSAIALMFMLRCLHPPGGAVALTSVLGGPAVTELGYRFALWPVALDSLCLLAVALTFNAAVGRRYPPRPAEPSHGTGDAAPSARVGVSSEDVDAALAARGEWLDISHEDLEEIIAAVEERAYRRHLGTIRCADVMAVDIVTVSPEDSLALAWSRLLQHHIKALPVLAREDSRVVGILSLHDFLLDAQPTAVGAATTAGGRVADRMSRAVVTARPDQSVGELVRVFSDAGKHHLPVVNEAGRLVGMLTQSDLVAALARANLEAGRDALQPGVADSRRVTAGTV